MPHFATNPGKMFREWRFLDRFGAAADAGGAGVEIRVTRNPFVAETRWSPLCVRWLRARLAARLILRA